MKKIILLLIVAATAQAQEATYHFFYGSTNSLGAEVLFKIAGTEHYFLGAGFGGATTEDKVLPGKVNEWDMKQTIKGHKNDRWCDIYLTGSLGYFKEILIKYRGGLGVYKKKVHFEAANNYQYTKVEKIVYQPIVGITATIPVYKDFAIEAGFDTFNKATIGFTVLFN